MGVTMRILTVRPRDPLLGGGVKFFYQETSLGDHEISHSEISPGYQENLLVNKFPVLTPPLISVLVVLVVNSFISLGHHEISHGEISLGDHAISHGEIYPGYQENLLVNKFPVLAPPPNFRSRRSRGE